MAKKMAPAASQKRKPRLLWANPFCLLDTSSGASMSIRQMLKQLVKAGYEIEILGATIFDNPKGTGLFQEKMAQVPGKKTQLMRVDDDELVHQLVITKNTYRNELTTHEEGKWFSQYGFMLDDFKPDIVWFYGGQTLDLLIADEARSRGIPSAFYLANGNYMSPRWSRDIDLVLTDSESTANMYREKIGFVATPVGKFIDTARFVAEQHQRKHVLFVNPSFEKGASVFVQLALKLEQERPDITLEVVEARADWPAVLKETTQLLGEPRDRLNNVTVTGNTSDMRPVYERARILLAPSLWWESGARVLAEAMLNGIPAIVSNHGGSAGLIADGGIVLDFPSAAYEKPYKHLLTDEELQPLYQAVVNLFDDEALYQSYVNKALEVGKEKHHISVSTKRLTQALAPLVAQKAGNKDFRVPQRKQHKHRLAGTVAKPTFASEVYVSPPPAAPQKVTAPAAPTSKPTPALDFDWQLSSKVVVLDNRAKLIKTGSADKLINTNAFTVLAFDPASEVVNANAYEGHEHIQLFQHALLGDGQPAALNACLEATLTSTLNLLPESALPEHRRQGAKVLTQLPINTIALDSIEGLPSLDWLILDDLSDATNILEHGKKALKNTLLIQARVAFQPTHERQPNIAQLSHWASRNGFRFYRLNDTSHQSLFPEDTDASKRFASELTSADALFLPSEERLEVMSDNDKQKLVFLLHTVFKASDMAYRIMQSVNATLAQNYLKFVEGEQNEVSQQAEEAVSNNVSQKITPDEVVAKILPDSTLEQPGSARWFIEKEKQFGGLVRNVARSKYSPKDVRSPEQIRRGGMQGGGRMSFNLHGYALAYAAFLKPMLIKAETERLTLVEVGILKGTGLATWCDLFPNGNVLGLDIDPENCRNNIPLLSRLGAFKKNQPKLYEFDQYFVDSAQVANMLQGNKIDIFVDDGAHTREAILNTFEAIKPHLADTFVAFIEDNDQIADELRSLLPEYRVISQGEMTVICPDIATFPRRLPTLKQLVFEAQVMQKRLEYQPNLEYPKTFNEKIVRRKLFGAPANAAILADKLAVRDYVKERVGEGVLTKIYQVVNSPEQIDWKALPKQFVMKSNHANAQVKIVRDKATLDKKEAEALCQKWLNSVYGKNSNEYWYSEIPPKVYFEELLLDDDKVAADYKVHVFNGCAEVIQVVQGREGRAEEIYLDKNWKPLDFVMANPLMKNFPKKPKEYKDLLCFSEKLADGYDYLRLDFYIISRGCILGEITLAHLAGWGKTISLNGRSDKEVDLSLGSLWSLKNL